MENRINNVHLPKKYNEKVKSFHVILNAHKDGNKFALVVQEKKVYKLQ